MISQLPLNSHSFTAKSDKRLRVLITPVKVCQAVTPTLQAQPTPEEFIAIWDTGATNSVVTQAVIKACGLAPTGVAQTHGVHGTQLSKTYLVDLHLPNGVAVRQVRVTEGILQGGKEGDVLLGMDIISIGDFSVTNKDGKTCFSFRVPSMVCTDYVAEDRTRAATPLPQASMRGERPKKVKRPKKSFGRNKR